MKEQVEAILEERLEGSGLFVVEIKTPGNKIEVYLDGDAGINIEECARVSSYLHKKLEEKGVDTGKFIVEISSPGIDNPLVSLREYKKNVGRKLSLRNAQNKILTGKLIYVDETGIVLSAGSKMRKETISFTEIKESKVVI